MPTSLPSWRVLGTTTSPYTRKVRILSSAAHLPFELVDTRSEAGVALLMKVAPLGKVPVVLIGDGDEAQVLPDSGLIAQRLWWSHHDTLRANSFSLEPEDWEDRAQTVSVEGALDAAINRFYLLRDGLLDIGYVTRQKDRVDTALAALDGRITFRRPCTSTMLSLGCALDWMTFRNVVDLTRWPGLAAFREAWIVSRIGAGTEPA